MHNSSRDNNSALSVIARAIVATADTDRSLARPTSNAMRPVSSDYGATRRYGPYGRNEPAVGPYSAFAPADPVARFAPRYSKKITSAFFPNGGGRVLSGTDFIQGGSLAAFQAALSGLTMNGDRRSSIAAGVVAGNTLVSSFIADETPYSIGILLRMGTVGTNNPNPFAGQNLRVQTIGFVPPLRPTLAATTTMIGADRDVRFTLEGESLGSAIFIPWLTEQFQSIGTVVAGVGMDNGNGVPQGATVTVTVPAGLAANTTTQVELVTCDHEYLDDIARMFVELSADSGASGG